MVDFTSLDPIIQLAADGLVVFPTKGKDPLTGHGYQDASQSKRMIQGWGQRFPGSNWAAATGDISGIAVLDIDGPAGRESLTGYVLPEGPAVSSGRIGGGEHRYFRYPGYQLKGRIGFLPGLDLKADGGYVIIPPSIHPETGTEYRWLTPFDPEALPELPDWLTELLRAKSQRGYNLSDLSEGSRNDDLTSLAGTLRLRGCDANTILTTLRSHNARQLTPLPDQELCSIAESIGNRPAASYLVPHPHTEAGYAKRMAAFHGGEIRYLKRISRWVEWDGQRWEKDESKNARMQGRTKELLAATFLAAETITDPNAETMIAKQKAFREAVQAKESKRAIDAIVDLARSEPGIMVEPSRLDSDPMLFNVANGTLDLRTGQLRNHDPADLITKISPITFDPEAPCPLWDRFVSEVFDGDAELIAYVRRALGYLLTGDTSEQDFWIAYGGWANGKSTLLNTVLGVLGDYGDTTPFTTFDSDNKNQFGNDIAATQGRRFVFASEAERDRVLAEAQVKSVTGGDAFSCKFLYGEYFSFVPQFKIWLAVNHKPNIRNADRGIWRRIKLIPFARNFEETEDKALKGKLSGESSGILNWLLAGLADWQINGMQEPASVKAATDEYRVESDQIGQWLGERAELGADYSQNISELYRAT